MSADLQYKAYVMVNDRVIVTIINHKNRCCFYITAIQMLHCSKTLEDILEANRDRLLRDFPTLFSPLLEYNRLTNVRLTVENISRVISSIEKAFSNSPQITGDGYSWNRLLSSFYIPVIFSLVNENTDKLVDILKEIYLLPDQLFNGTTLDFDKILTQREKEKIIPYVENYIRNYQDIRKRLSECSYPIKLFPIETYLGKEHGHVFTAVIGNNDNLYAIDVDVIEPLKYHIEHYKNIDKIRFASLQNEDIIQRLEKEFGKGDRSQYSISWYTTPLSGGSRNSNLSISGGSRNSNLSISGGSQDSNLSRYLFIASLSVLIICLILCICIYLCSLSHHIDPIDRTKRLRCCKQ